MTTVKVTYDDRTLLAAVDNIYISTGACLYDVIKQYVFGANNVVSSRFNSMLCTGFCVVPPEEIDAYSWALTEALKFDSKFEYRASEDGDFPLYIMSNGAQASLVLIQMY